MRISSGRWWTAVLVAASLTALLAPSVSADDTVLERRALFGIDAELFGGLPFDRLNSDLFSFGGGFGLGFEINAHPLVGIHLAGGALWMPSGGANPSATEWIGARLGARFHWGVLAGTDPSDGWADAHFDFGQSAGIRRPGFDLAVGYAIGLAGGAVRIGPFVRYQFGSDPLGNHASLLLVGITVGLLGDPRQDVVAEAGEESPRDTDDDGVLDSNDVCPMEPAGARPDPDRPGCSIRDQDADGIVDASDHCPALAAGASPDPNRAGCPSGDRDGDGVLDHADVCPDVAAGPHPDPARRGCPLPDGDADSVPDPVDACPSEPGAPSRDPARNGCPGLVRIQENRIQILRPVFFEFNSDVIETRSHPVLEAVAESIALGGVGRLRVEGHTDNVGPAEYNLQLSRRRAVSVVRFLSTHGVDGDRLEAVGHGETRPIDTNGTEAGQANNRRVEFHILDFMSGPAP